MTITVNLYDTATLLGVMRQMEPVSSYWLDLCFPYGVNFTDEYIDFEKIVEGRKIAPFVTPMSQGKPIYSEKSEVTRLKPAYLKMKDPVSPNRLFKKSAASGGVMADGGNPASRYNAIVGDILRTHRNAADRRDEWLAAQAIINGKVTIVDESYPERLVDYKRNANHTVVLGSGARWGDSGVSIIHDLETWRTRIRRAKFGGPTNRMTMGADVWEVLRKDPEILKQLDTQMRGTDAQFRTGLREGEEAEFMGRLSGTLDMWVYSGYYEDASGTAVDYMSSKDVVLTGPNVMGHRCYGAILDKQAQYQAMRLFPKMWENEDPSVVYVMSQSAPLMVPVNPNNTLKATVLA
jgi:hypothetical protein